MLPPTPQGRRRSRSSLLSKRPSVPRRSMPPSRPTQTSPSWAAAIETMPLPPVSARSSHCTCSVFASRRSRSPVRVPTHKAPSGACPSIETVRPVRLSVPCVSTGVKRVSPRRRRASPFQVPTHSVPAVSNHSDCTRSSGRPLSSRRWRTKSSVPGARLCRPPPVVPTQSTPSESMARARTVPPASAVGRAGSGRYIVQRWVAVSRRASPSPSRPTHSLPSAAASRLRTKLAPRNADCGSPTGTGRNW